MRQRLVSSLYYFLWAVLLLFLPVTSLPLLSRIVGGSMVAPAAAMPLALLVLIFVPVYYLQRPHLPRIVLPLFAFVLAAVFSTALSFFIEFPLFRDADRLRNALSGFLTLAIGIAFFLAALILTKDQERLGFFFRWINFSGGVVLLWAGLQSAFWYLNGNYPDWMREIQSLISSSGNLYNRRTTGFAFEPSWLGHQLVIFYLPFWLAASYRQYSVFRWRIWKFTVEHLLLGGGVLVLVLSLARSALLSFSLSFGWLMLMITARLIGWLHLKIVSRLSKPPSRKVTLFLKSGIWLLIFGFYAGVLLTGVYVLTRLDPRMENLFRVLTDPYSPLEAANSLFFGERAAFWITGLQIFNDFPLFGVGMENAGYFFPEKLPPLGWTVAESHKLYYSSALPNTLSLWIRLLSETGVVGFSLFFSFLYLLWRTSRFLGQSQQPLIATLALTAQLAIIALLMEGMSVDTFAFPYFWLIFGWLAAALNFSNSDALQAVNAGQGVSTGGANGQTSSVAYER